VLVILVGQQKEDLIFLTFLPNGNNCSNQWVLKSPTWKIKTLPKQYLILSKVLLFSSVALTPLTNLINSLEHEKDGAPPSLPAGAAPIPEAVGVAPVPQESSSSSSAQVDQGAAQATNMVGFTSPDYPGWTWDGSQWVFTGDAALPPPPAEETSTAAELPPAPEPEIGVGAPAPPPPPYAMLCLERA